MNFPRACFQSYFKSTWIHYIYIHLREYFIGPWYVSDFHFRTLPWTAFGIVAVYLYHIHIRICLKMGYPKICEKYSRRFPFKTYSNSHLIPSVPTFCSKPVAKPCTALRNFCWMRGWGWAPKVQSFTWWKLMDQSSSKFKVLQLSSILAWLWAVIQAPCQMCQTYLFLRSGGGSAAFRIVIAPALSSWIWAVPSRAGDWSCSRHLQGPTIQTALETGGRIERIEIK